MRPTTILLLLLPISQIHAPHVDKTLYTILAYNHQTQAAMGWRLTSARSAKLTALEVDAMEPMVDSACFAFNRESNSHALKLLPLSRYRRQYVALVDQYGDSLVWINFFCSDDEPKWRRRVVRVIDGGNYYFQMFLNWSKRKVMSLTPNSVASTNPNFPSFASENKFLPFQI